MGIVPQMNSAPAEEAGRAGARSAIKASTPGRPPQHSEGGQGGGKGGALQWQALKSCRTVHCRRQGGVDRSQHPN